jgi:cation diffusion facilitator family transporter
VRFFGDLRFCFGYKAAMSTSHSAEKQRVAFWSLLASGGLAIVKFAAAIVSGSLGLLSEAFHSLTDCAATALTLIAVRVSDKPADAEHHYGHAKAESVVALVETGMLFAVTGYIAYEAITRLWSGGHEIELSWWLFAIVVASIIIDFNRSRALRRTAEKTQSAALAADALHFAADMWSSIAVLMGLALVWAGFGFADSVAALVVAAFVAHAAWNLGKQTLDNLLDAAPVGVASAIEDIVSQQNGVLDLRQLRVRPAGPDIHVDMIADVPRTMAVSKLDQIRRALSESILRQFPNADSSIQLNPVELDTETAFEKVALIAEKHDLKVHHLAVQNLDGRLAVSFDVEMDADTALLTAHDRATALEADIRDGLGMDVEVESHIEPMEPRLLDGAAPALELVDRITTQLAHLARRERSLSDLHNIRVRSNAAGLYVHYHCRFAPDLSIAKVHEVTDRIEMALMTAIPEISRVVAHAEPVGHGKHRL